MRSTGRLGTNDSHDQGHVQNPAENRGVYPQLSTTIFAVFQQKDKLLEEVF